MNDPIAKAKWVLETKGVIGTPAEHLHEIARQENIRFKYACLPNDPKLGGQLLYKGEKKGIIINTLIDNKGRHNFTFAHELGHYFLKHPPSYTLDGQVGFWCSTDDIGDSYLPREIEANRFAVELLMPEDRFRLDMTGAPIDFVLIEALCKYYMVSKMACSNRILSLTQAPCAIIRYENEKVIYPSTSKAAKGFLKRISIVPPETIASDVINKKIRQKGFARCDADKWLMRRIPGNAVYERTHLSKDQKYAMTILKW